METASISCSRDHGYRQVPLRVVLEQIPGPEHAPSGGWVLGWNIAAGTITAGMIRVLPGRAIWSSPHPTR